jgi:hypothetical protein
VQTDDNAAARLDELADVRRKVRADRRPASVPLLVLGAAMMVLVAVKWAVWVTETSEWWADLYWAVAAPIVFTTIARWYRAVEREVGVRTERALFRKLALGAVVALVLFPVFVAIPLGLPYGILGLALLVVAWRLRSGFLAVGALTLGVGGVLETFFVLSNRVHDVAGGYIGWASPTVWTLIAVTLLALAAAARIREADG